MRLALLVLVLVLAGCGGHGRSFVVGAVEDAPKWNADAAAKAKAAGFQADVLSAVWQRGASAQSEAGALRPAIASLGRAGVAPVLAVYQLSSNTPVSEPDRQAFAAYAAGLVRALPQVQTVIVGNEPNLNLFWLPQFDAGGGDAAAASYEQLLVATYDAIKQARSSVTVAGGALSPRGGDNPSASRQTHSPTRFIEDLGAAYRSSGRTKPLMDELDVHVYGESPRIPPTFTHPRSTSIGIADYGKLVALVKQAFGKELPIVYGEYGVETSIPAAKQSLYTGHEVVQPVDESTQARYYVEAIDLASCQKDVRALYLFHVLDEQNLAGLQSGVYYADGSPKSSLPAVRQAIEHPKCRS
ncbi:MAG TPA: hypothetical protein VFB25_10035 [Gaiellaceae bacterium]|nr:hypothetical protein [Gaiellaceae bacterium]